MLPISNWPLGYPPLVSAPDGLLAELADAEVRLQEARRQLAQWEHETLERKRLAWINYHDAHGWPDDPDYKARLKREAQID